jgi:hypothetical protein
VVTVSKPLNDFITGGGYLVLAQSAGLKAGDVGSKNNFGFNVKYNHSGSNLQGKINIIIRRTESDGVLHVYQIKGNSMTSLSVNTSTGKATFNGKANIQDITDPLSPVSVDGNATLQVTMTDRGEPGSTDSIAVTVWNKDGGLWFASHWDGTQTVERTLGGGNLVVHAGALQALGGVATISGRRPALSAAALAPIVVEAAARWQQAGFGRETEALNELQVFITDLAGPILGWTSAHVIWIDQDAAGHGWFIDPTPAEDEEFTGTAGDVLGGRMDLLTVVMHEMGHVLGHDHDAGGVMAESLAAGVRETPERDGDLPPTDVSQGPALNGFFVQPVSVNGASQEVAIWFVSASGSPTARSVADPASLPGSKHSLGLPGDVLSWLFDPSNFPALIAAPPVFAFDPAKHRPVLVNAPFQLRADEVPALLPTPRKEHALEALWEQWPPQPRTLSHSEAVDLIFGSLGDKDGEHELWRGKL